MKQRSQKELDYLVGETMKYRQYTKWSLRKQPEGSETLERLKRWPSLRNKWVGQKVRIWSSEHNLYWNANCCGYTFDGLKAGIYDFEEAFKATFGCGYDKKIEFRKV